MAVMAAVAFSLTTSLASGQVNAKGTEQDLERLRSVLVRPNEVFASTLGGLFRADRDAKQWERLPTPKTLPPGGLFAQGTSRHGWVYYYTPKWIAGSIPSPESFSFGLYCSRDAGQKWELVSSSHDFTHVYVLGADLYGISDVMEQIPSDQAEGIGMYVSEEETAPGKHTVNYQRAFWSRDAGRTWRDISNGVARGMSLFSISPDPDHEGLICLHGNCIRGYVLQADDTSYKWKMTQERGWRAEHETDQTFFGGDHYWVFFGVNHHGAYSIGYMHGATLSNYFDFPFGERTQIPGFEIRTAATHTFGKGRAITLPLEVIFLPEGPAVAILDASNEVGFWGLRRILPNGERELVRAPFEESVYRSKEREDTVAGIRRSPSLRLHVLSHDHVYRRSLDLSELCDFEEIGTYRVQIFYMGIADGGEGGWTGTFSSPVFEIEIKESHGVEPIAAAPMGGIPPVGALVCLALTTGVIAVTRRKRRHANKPDARGDI